MNFAEPLIPGRLVRRYKRFLADVELESGIVTAHCANPGKMTGLAEPGMKVWLEPNDDPKKKLKYSWKLVELPAGLACVDTALPNRVVGEALDAGLCAELGFADVRREAPYGERSRVDFLLTDPGELYLEVKCVTLELDRIAAFPDTVTTRGARHLRDLADVVRSGARAMLLYLVHRTDCERVTVATSIDPGYAAAYAEARAAGVEVVAYQAQISHQGVTLGPRLPVIDP